MKTIVDILSEKKDFVSLTGASSQDIADAAKILGVQFAEDYIEYVTKFGAASYYGHELTGVCKAKSLDVVGVTISEKEFNDVPADWYVIEQAHIDGIVFWQAADGKIYQTAPHRNAEMICESLTEYVNLN